MKYYLYILLTFLAFSCTEESNNSLASYLEDNSELEQDNVIACAGGKVTGIFNDPTSPTSIIFYPIEGAFDIRYYEAAKVKDALDFDKYELTDLPVSPLFNGYLMKFDHVPFSGERMGIVTYQVNKVLHISDPIRLKTNPKPTEVNNGLANINENGITPSFSWQDGDIEENVIYFQLLSDENNDFVSGTYTLDREFTFYNTENIVLDINQSIPSLVPNSEYTFTLMAVSDDNWVNLFVQKKFRTD